MKEIIKSVKWGPPGLCEGRCTVFSWLDFDLKIGYWMMNEHY